MLTGLPGPGLVFFVWVAILVGCCLLVGAVGLGLLFNNSGGPVTLNQVLKFLIFIFHHVF